jgi:hypothetical protein
MHLPEGMSNCNLSDHQHREVYPYPVPEGLISDPSTPSLGLYDNSGFGQFRIQVFYNMSKRQHPDSSGAGMEPKIESLKDFEKGPSICPSPTMITGSCCYVTLRH